MTAIIIRRLGRALIAIWFVVTIVFVVLRLSGDPVRLLLPESAPISQVESLRAELGLDRSISIQYVRFWQSVAAGDLGQSMRFGQPAADLVLARFPATVQLAAAAFAIAAVVGLGMGILTAIKWGTSVDRSIMALMGMLQAAPSFFLAIVLILLFSVRLGWLPTSGYGAWQQLILPAIALSGLTAASIARLTRSSLLDVLRADYIRTARSKGLHERTVWMRHALRNASLPIVTMLGLELAYLLTGAVIVETVFAWPGVGRLAIEAVATRDYPVVQATVILMAIVFVTVNLLVDLLYVALDPRV